MRRPRRETSPVSGVVSVSGGEGPDEAVGEDDEGKDGEEDACGPKGDSGGRKRPQEGVRRRSQSIDVASVGDGVDDCEDELSRERNGVPGQEAWGFGECGCYWDEGCWRVDDVVEPQPRGGDSDSI